MTIRLKNLSSKSFFKTRFRRRDAKKKNRMSSKQQDIGRCNVHVVVYPQEKQLLVHLSVKKPFNLMKSLMVQKTLKPVLDGSKT